jgi:DNA polymerase III subunit beta
LKNISVNIFLDKYKLLKLKIDITISYFVSSFKISRSNALKCMNHVIGSSDKTDDLIDFVNYTKIEIKDNIATFYTTNLDMESSCSCVVESDSNFSFLAPIQNISNITKKLSEKSEISFTVSKSESENMSLKIQSGNFKFDVSISSEKSFPSMAGDTYESNFKIKPKDLVEAIEKTKFSISNDESRYNLTGLMIHCENKNINFVSTDGHRLSVVTLKNQDIADFASIIVPKKSIIEIAKIASSTSEEELDIKFSKSGKLSISTKDSRFTTKLINGTFPDYKRVIPANGDKTLKTKSIDLLRALNLVSGVGGDIGAGLELKISFDKIEISGKTDVFSSSESIPCEFSSQEIFCVKYNHKYMTEALSACGSGSSCIMKFSNIESPVLLSCSEDGDDKSSIEAVFVIMPLKN